ncbi:MAG TPA: hypothetical protein VMH30_08160 [Verrucomicrobiae bacterium]|nr:hypothetical protein [Candidatus Sulfotelmatobacter sp.]HTV62524.1 hypothetical protein [Verrucomicrobiae bacterium]
MAETANITSVDAIDAFRAALIVFLSKVRPLLEETSGEIIRVRQWIEEDQRRHWDHQFRLRWRKLEEAKAELFTATMSKLQEASSLHTMAVQRADRAVREAEAKLAMLRKWSRDLSDKADPLLKQASQFETFLTTEMPRAVAYLDRVIETIEAYAGVASPKQGGPA